jgi:hypothetical protein
VASYDICGTDLEFWPFQMTKKIINYDESVVFFELYVTSNGVFMFQCIITPFALTKEEINLFSLCFVIS